MVSEGVERRDAFVVSSWCFHGVFMVFSWCFHGVFEVFSWCFLGVEPEGCLWAGVVYGPSECLTCISCRWSAVIYGVVLFNAGLKLIL